MKILIPTAKEMKTRKSQASSSLSHNSQLILNTISQLDVSNLQHIYKIKENQSLIEYHRWQDLKNATASSYPALELFNGLMYRHIAFDNTPETFDFIRQNVFIASSFYGIINALDPISEHRLDFNIPLKVVDKSLKQIWRDEFNDFVAKNQPILSLLSSEFEDVFSKNYRQRLISTSFFEEKDGKLKKHSTISKKARGALLSKIIRQKITKIDDVKSLTFDNFSYDEAKSNETEIVFIKKA